MTQSHHISEYIKVKSTKQLVKNWVLSKNFTEDSRLIWILTEVRSENWTAECDSFLWDIEFAEAKILVWKETVDGPRMTGVYGKFIYGKLQPYIRENGEKWCLF